MFSLRIQIKYIVSRVSGLQFAIANHLKMCSTRSIMPLLYNNFVKWYSLHPKKQVILEILGQINKKVK